MSTNIAYFRDIKPERLQRQMRQAETAPRSDSIISDMADGNLATEFIFSFAGFKYAESHFALTLIGIIGDGQKSIELFDEEIAKTAQCDERTVRRWRSAYLEKAKSLNFWPLEILQGDYDQAKQRYFPTSYRVTFADTLENIVATARASSDYLTDRRGAIERAASRLYEDIEQAPSKMRRRKPKRAAQTPLADIAAASKKLRKAQTSVREMPERQRNAFINGQGEDLRDALDAMRAQMAEFEKLLSGDSANVESSEVANPLDKMSGIPPSVEKSAVDVRVKDKEEARTSTEPKPVHSPEDVAAFDSILTRFREPQVTRAVVEVGCRAPSASPPPEISPRADGEEAMTEPIKGVGDTDTHANEPDYFYLENPPDPDEIAEAEAIRLEACGELFDERQVE